MRSRVEEDDMSIAIWKWRFAGYTDAELSEIYRRDAPGKEGEAALAAMEVLAERAVAAQHRRLG
jgi:hypothetical protein